MNESAPKKFQQSPEDINDQERVLQDSVFIQGGAKMKEGELFVTEEQKSAAKKEMERDINPEVRAKEQAKESLRGLYETLGYLYGDQAKPRDEQEEGKRNMQKKRAKEILKEVGIYVVDLDGGGHDLFYKIEAEVTHVSLDALGPESVYKRLVAHYLENPPMK